MDEQSGASFPGAGDVASQKLPSLVPGLLGTNGGLSVLAGWRTLTKQCVISRMRALLHPEGVLGKMLISVDHPPV